MADQHPKPSLPKNLNRRELDFDILSIARMKRDNHGTKQLIAGARREITASYTLLAKLDRFGAGK